jgi:signal recognition particle GTPase
VNEPDLVLFVGEALVGNEAVDQLVKFNQALADYSATANPHLIDGIVLTKFDTIDDKVHTFIHQVNTRTERCQFKCIYFISIDAKSASSVGVYMSILP